MVRPVAAVVGPGRLGTALAWRLVASGLDPILVRGRHPPAGVGELPRGTLTDTWQAPRLELLPALVVVTVPDDALTGVAGQLAATPTLDNVVVLHTSGLHPAAALASCRARGADVASWHPLQSFPPRRPGQEPPRWDGVPCAVEGDGPAVRRGFELARRLGLAPWLIAAGDKPRYHAAAALAGNLTHVLVAAAVSMMDACGLPRDTGPDHPLAPLVTASVAGALASPDLSRLTGAVARGDRATIARHVAALDDDLAAAYRALASFVGRSLTSTWLD